MLTPQEVSAAWGLQGIDREILERLYDVRDTYGRTSVSAIEQELIARTNLKNSVESGCAIVRAELFTCGQALHESITGDCPPKDLP